MRLLPRHSQQNLENNPLMLFFFPSQLHSRPDCLLTSPRRKSTQIHRKKSCPYGGNEVSENVEIYNLIIYTKLQPEGYYLD